MNCRECRDKLSLYLDGQLTDEETVRFEEALSRCPDCARELEELRTIIEELEEVEPVAVPTDLLQDLKSAFREEKAQESARDGGGRPSIFMQIGRWRVAAAAAALLFATWAVVQDQMANRVAAPGEMAEVDSNARPDRRVRDEEQGVEGQAQPHANMSSPTAEVKRLEMPDSLDKGADSAIRQRRKFGVKEAAGLNLEDIEEETEEQDSLIAGSALVDEYALIARKAEDLLGKDFRTEPLDRSMLAFLSESELATAMKKSLDSRWANGRGTLPTGGDVVEERQTPRGAPKPQKKPGLQAKKKAETKPSKAMSPNAAWFALGRDADQTIADVAARAGLKIERTSIGKLGAGEKARGGSVLTLEVTASERDALLLALEKAGLKLRLFGRTRAKADDKLDSAKGSPAAAPKDSGGAGDKQEAKKSAKERTSRFRISFISLKS